MTEANEIRQNAYTAYCRKEITWEMYQDVLEALRAGAIEARVLARYPETKGMNDERI